MTPGAESELESESKSISIFDLVFVSALLLFVCSFGPSRLAVEFLASPVVPDLPEIPPFFLEEIALGAAATTEVVVANNASKLDSGSTSNKDLPLPFLMVSAALRAACRCGT